MIEFFSSRLLFFCFYLLLSHFFCIIQESNYGSDFVKRTLLVFLCFFLLSDSFSEEKRETTITGSLLQNLRQSFEIDDHLRLSKNALSGLDATKISISREKTLSLDEHFTHKLSPQTITAQKSTGRCWMFAGLNILRPVLRENLGIKDIELSESYLFFFDKLEKSNLFLESIIQTRNKPYDDRYVTFLMHHVVPDGGQWVGIVELIKKYGVVPKDIFPETYSSSNSKTMNRTLELSLKAAAVQLRKPENDSKLEAIKLKALENVYRILVLNLGEPPAEFRWRYENQEKYVHPYQTYTPQSFYETEIGIDLDAYYCLYSIPTRPFNRNYEIDLDRAVYEKPGLVFVNVPVNTLKELSRSSLLDDNPVWFGCDVGRESERKTGLIIPDIYDLEALYGMSFDMSREAMFLTHSNAPTHAMVFTGLDLVDGEVQKWLVENSWGKSYGKKGYFFMADSWFDYYVQMIVVHKQYIPEKILKIFEKEPELLPPWDPMYKVVKMVN